MYKRHNDNVAHTYVALIMKSACNWGGGALHTFSILIKDQFCIKISNKSNLVNIIFINAKKILFI